MNFWIIAAVLLGVAAAAMCWPLLGGAGKDRVTGILVVLAMPLIGLSMYNVIGTPDAIGMSAATPQSSAQAQAQMPHAAEGGEMEMLLQQLQQRLAENPNDAEGWVVLGRTLKSQQRFAEALAALENANRTMPDQPTIMVELAEAKLFASGNPVITADIRQLLEGAIAIEPHQQKGLWLLGMADAEDGNYAGAIATWQSLLGLLEPGSGSYERVNAQIAEAQGLLGQPVLTLPDAEQEAAPDQQIAPQPTGPVSVAEGGIPVTIGIAPELTGTVPGNAPLFVFIHPAGGAGMPLAVKRLAASTFPMSLNFTDADLLQQGNSLQNFEKLDISARIALGGGVNPMPGDIQANKVTVDTMAVERVTLQLDQRIQ
ncbi:MAG: hypothetical protein PVJ71_00865 [Lysobacterales bacterium]|jgi:cytochrome c-type biogenesis protein CcmH